MKLIKNKNEESHLNINQYIVDLNIEKELKTRRNQGLAKAVKLANKTGPKNIPRLSATPFSSEEHELKAFIQEGVSKIGTASQTIAKAITEIKTKFNEYEELKNKLKEDADVVTRIYDDEKRSIQNGRNKRESDIRDQLGEKINVKKEDLKISVKKIRAIEGAGGFAEFIPNEKRKFYIIGSIIMALFEVVLSTQAFFVLRHNMLISYGTALAYGLLVWGCAKGAGNSYCNYTYSKKQKDLTKTFIWVVGGLVGAFGLFLLRCNYFGISEGGNSITPAIVISTFSFIIFLIAAFFEYKGHIPQKYREYLKEVNKRQQLEQEVENLENKLNSSKEEYFDKIKHVEDKYRNEIETLSKPAQNKYDILKEKHLQLNESLQYLTMSEKKMCDIFEEVINKFRTTNKTKRPDESQPDYWEQGIIPTLDTYYHDLKIPVIDPKGIGGLVIESSFPVNPVIDTRKNGHKTSFSDYSFPLIILLFAGLFFSSCSENNLINNDETGVLIADIIDTSKDYETDTTFDKSRSSKMIDKIANDDSNSLLYMATSIGNASINSVHEFKLSATSLLENPLNRADEKESFADSINIIWKQIIEKRRKEASQRSLIYEKVCYVMNQIDQQNTYDKYEKIFIISSDGLQNSSLFSFYNIDKNTFNPYSETVSNIRKMLEQNSCIIPDLSGATVYFEYQTNVDNEDFVAKVRLFWKYLFEERGAKVFFVSNW